MQSELDDKDTKDTQPVNTNFSNHNDPVMNEPTDLESEVAALREENQRLQVESQTAAQQLRRFTEWFFQTSQHDDRNEDTITDSNLPS